MTGWNPRRGLLPLALAIPLGLAGCGGGDSPGSARPTDSPTTIPARPETMNLRLRLDDRVLTATLNDSEAARDFASLLPLTLTMGDLFGREKFARLPRAISTGGERTHTYEVGDIGYWPPGPDVAIFYRQDGQRIPDPGIVRLGKIDAGVEALATAGRIRLELAGDE